MKDGKKLNITTIKLKIETKTRLDHLKEFEKESYDEIIKKVLFILNNLRSNSEVAAGILRNIDLKVKRKSQVYSGALQEKPENPEKEPENKAIKDKRPENRIQNKFIRKLR